MNTTTPSAAIEAMARAVYQDRNGRGCNPWAHTPRAYQAPYIADATAALSALCSLHPGIAEVIAGRAVVVPRKLLTEAHACMRATGWQLAPDSQNSDDGVIEAAVAEIEARVGELLAASPYALPSLGEGDQA